MPTVQSAPHRHRLSVDDFYKMGDAGIFTEDDRVELIEGELIDMSPIGSPHAYILDKLNAIFVKQAPATALVRIQNPIRLDQYNEPQPDLVVAIHRDYSKGHPAPKDVLLVAEVADSSLRYDRNTKAPLYAQHAIPEMWLFDVEAQTVEVFLEPATDRYRHTRRVQNGTLSPGKVPDIILDLARLWTN